MQVPPLRQYSIEGSDTAGFGHGDPMVAGRRKKVFINKEEYDRFVPEVDLTQVALDSR